MYMSNATLSGNSSLVEFAQAEQVLAEEVAAIVGTATIPVNGVQMTGAQLATLFGGHVAEIGALVKAKAQLHDQVLAQRSSQANSRAAALALKAWVVGTYGASSPQATTLGFQPANRHPASVATKADAQVKSKATREERHTMGKRQKAGIHGTVSTAPSPSPAPAAPPVPAPPNNTGR
jgi:hypothetical protein